MEDCSHLQTVQLKEWAFHFIVTVVLFKARLTPKQMWRLAINYFAQFNGVSELNELQVLWYADVFNGRGD